MITYHGTFRVSMFAAIVATIVSNCCGAEGERRCGARSLQIVLEGYGIDAPLSQIEGGLPRKGEDATFAELAEFASTEFGLCSSAVRWTNAPFRDAPQRSFLLPEVEVDSISSRWSVGMMAKRSFRMILTCVQ